jgi:hypothetical protein
MALLPNTGVEIPDIGGDTDQWGGINNGAHQGWDAFFQNLNTAPAYEPVLRLQFGGTGAKDAAGGRTNLGLKAMAVADDVGAGTSAFVRKNNAWAALVWGDIGGVPSSFPPSAHTHPTSEITGLDSELTILGNEIGALQDADVAIREEMTQVVSVTKSAAHTLALSDAGKILYFDSAAPAAFTIPDNTAVPIPVDTRIDLGQLGTGALSITPGSGVTLNSYEAKRALAGQFAGATLHKIATNTWMLFGNLA